MAKQTFGTILNLFDKKKWFKKNIPIKKNWQKRGFVKKKN